MDAEEALILSLGGSPMLSPSRLSLKGWRSHGCTERGHLHTAAQERKAAGLPWVNGIFVYLLFFLYFATSTLEETVHRSQMFLSEDGGCVHLGFTLTLGLIEGVLRK